MYQPTPVQVSIFKVLPICRQFEEHFFFLESADQNEIHEMSKCLKPCNYMVYQQVDQYKVTEHFGNYDFHVALLPATVDVTVVKEVLLHPFTSLVADFGGTLGLFIGFSFMSPWSAIENLYIIMKTLKKAT